ncbi:ankyrin repeat and SOCS box protein 15-like [Tubulanus polymorphus]|uniref:ankyrin repeat and SOCS box protein 15-like n=1 Tax=Tubulanus polymorphus TaxID=672921 RepID=UPI003DA1FFC8
MDSGSSDSEQDKSAPHIQRLLADTVIYKSPFSDIARVINGGGDLNKPVVKGLCALHYAVYDNDTDYTTELIRMGASVHVTDDVGYTPLHICAKHGHCECMQILIDNGAFVNFCGGGSSIPEASQIFGYLTIEPLNLAIENNNVSCVRMLLDRGAKPDNRYFLGYEINLVPLENLKCLELLLNYGADPDVFSRSGLNALMKACKEQNLDAMKLLIKHGADVNISNNPRFDEKTPLYYAIMGGNPDVIQILLDANVDLTKPVCHNMFPLTLAVSRDKLAVSRLLLDYGASVDEKNFDGMNPLISICTSSYLKHQYELLELILDNGADPNVHFAYVSHSCPSLAPIVEYFVYNDEINPDLVHALIKYGARVTLCESTTRMFKIQNAFGIIRQMHKFARYPDVFNLVLDAVDEFEILAIKLSNLTLDKQQQMIVMATNPMSLRRLARFRLRRLLKPVLPRRVACLPLPELLKSYILYEAKIESKFSDSDEEDGA